MAATTGNTSQAATEILALALELGGLAIVIAVAGISEGMETLMMVFVIGVALLWLLLNYSHFNGLLNSISNVERSV